MHAPTIQDLFGTNSVFVDGTLYLNISDMEGNDYSTPKRCDPDTGDAETLIYHIVRTLSSNCRYLQATGKASRELYATASGLRVDENGVSKTFDQQFILPLGLPSRVKSAKENIEENKYEDAISFSKGDVGRTIYFHRPETTVLLQVQEKETADIWAIHMDGVSATTSKGVVTWDEAGYLWDFIENVEDKL
jgi:hypothetical protein